MLPSILFVDDEVNVLSGLRRLLYPMRRQWLLHFASSGDEALQILAQAPFDVIVSDVRMPGLDGSQLLAEVRRRYPNTARIILSGQCDQELALRSVGLAHQYLSKPCDPNQLAESIGRLCSLQRMLANQAIKQVVSRLEAVPSLPAHYTAVLRELESGEVSLPRVGRMIAQDAGMSAKMLQLVNSSFFGMPRHYASAEEAAVLIGTDMLRALVLGSHIFTQFDGENVKEDSFEKVWKHSLLTSRIANEVAASVGVEKVTAVQSSTAGLLSAVGTLAMVSQLPREFSRAEKLAMSKEHFWEAEMEVFGLTHADVGAYLMGLWGLPDPIVEAIALHHRPSVGRIPGFTPLTAVHVAEPLAVDPMIPDRELACGYLKEIGLLDRLPEWRRVATRLIQGEGRSGA